MSSRPTIYSDIDSTIWDLESWCVDAARNQYGVEIKESDINSWTYFKDNFGPDWWGIFEEALDPARIMFRPFFPDALNVLEWLDIVGFDLHFISHNPKPNQMYDAVGEWLSHHLPSTQFTLTIFGARNDKVDTMKEDSTAWGIIEDKPSTLIKAYKAGYHTFGKIRSANKVVREQYPGIIWFDDWMEIPYRIQQDGGLSVH